MAFLLIWIWLSVIGTAVLWILYGMHLLLVVPAIGGAWVLSSLYYLWRWHRHPARS